MIRALENMMADTNKMFDHPSYRICRFTLLELEEAQQYGDEAVRCLVKDEDRAVLQDWLTTLDRMLAAAGDLDGKAPKSGETVARHFSATPYRTIRCRSATSDLSTPTTWASTPRRCSSIADIRRCPRRSCFTSSGCARSTCRR